MKKISFLTVVFTLFISSFAMADNRTGAMTFSLNEAYYHFAQKRHIENVGMPNFALAYNFNTNWAIEGDVGVINTKQTSRNAQGFHSGVHGFLYMVDGIYRFTPYKYLEPYILAGIGVLSLKPDYSTTIHQGNINAGMGTQLFIHRSIAFRGELRDIYTVSGGKNDVMANVGISFLFDV